MARKAVPFVDPATGQRVEPRSPNAIKFERFIFDALPHAFWYDPQLPESIEANHTMADFFVEHLGK